MRYDEQNSREQYVLGLRTGQDDASDGKPFRLPRCSAQFEAGYREGFESVDTFIKVPTFVRKQ